MLHIAEVEVSEVAVGGGGDGGTHYSNDGRRQHRRIKNERAVRGNVMLHAVHDIIICSLTVGDMTRSCTLAKPLNQNFCED